MARGRLLPSGICGLKHVEHAKRCFAEAARAPTYTVRLARAGFSPPPFSAPPMGASCFFVHFPKPTTKTLPLARL